jgi:hypothetical protein
MKIKYKEKKKENILDKIKIIPILFNGTKQFKNHGREYRSSFV